MDTGALARGVDRSATHTISESSSDDLPGLLGHAFAPRRAIPLDSFRLTVAPLIGAYCVASASDNLTLVIRLVLASAILVGLWPRLASACLLLMLVRSEVEPADAIAPYLASLTLFWLCLLPIGHTLTVQRIVGAMAAPRVGGEARSAFVARQWSDTWREWRARTVPGDVLALYAVQAGILYISGGLWKTQAVVPGWIALTMPLALAAVPIAHLVAGPEHRKMAVVIQGALHAGSVVLGGSALAHALLFASGFAFTELARGSRDPAPRGRLSAAGALAFAYLMVLVLLVSATIFESPALHVRAHWLLQGLSLSPPDHAASAAED